MSALYYIWSIRHNVGIILIFLRHNAVVSENWEKCMNILQAARSTMNKVDKNRNIFGP